MSKLSYRQLEDKLADYQRTAKRFELIAKNQKEEIDRLREKILDLEYSEPTGIGMSKEEYERYKLITNDPVEYVKNLEKIKVTELSKKDEKNSN
jgi:hypothetical protein